MDKKNAIFREVDCIVCGSKKHKSIYASEQPAGKVLGTLDICLSACEECGFVWQNPQLKPEILTNYYASDINASGSVYHDRAPDSKHSRKQQARVNFFGKFLKDLRDAGSLLEIGCSTGEFLLALDLPNWELFGVEPSQVAAAQARKSGIIVHNSGVEDLSIEVEKYDAIGLFSVMEHLSDLPEVMRKISQSLKKGGFFLFEIPDSEKASPQLAEFFGYEHLWHFTRSSCSRFLAQFGFSEMTLDPAVNDARLRAIVVKTGEIKKALDIQPTSEVDLINVIEKYQSDRRELIQSIGHKISQFIEDSNMLNGKGLAIYGGGIHTYHLLNHYPQLRNCEAVIDSNSEKWGTEIGGIPIISPEEAILSGVGAIIISSNAFESEIHSALVKNFPQFQGKILKVYS